MKINLQILTIFFLAIFSNQAISQENIINKTSDIPTDPKVKPLLKNKTPSPILKNDNKNSNNSIKTSAPNPINNDSNIKLPNQNSDIKPEVNSVNIKNNNSLNSSTANVNSLNPPPVNSNINNSNNSNSNASNSLGANKSSNQSLLENNQPNKNTGLDPEVSKKTPETNSKNSTKNIFNKNQKSSKRNIKKPKKNIKTTPPKLDKIANLEPENKKYINENGRKINSDYFLQILPKKSCDTITQTECFRRDRKNEEPYFHKTVINIFNNHIVAEQYFTTTNNNKKIFLKVNNGNYQLTTTNDNLISFTVKEGLVKDLTLISGNISRENLIVAKCILAEKYQGYFMAYNKQPKISEISFFSNKNNFEGVRNLVVFSDIDNIDNLTLQDLMAVEVKAYNNISAIQNLNLCKTPKSDILEVRDISHAECRKRQECLILLNSNPDFEKNIIDESCLGYFDSKREDFQTCSNNDGCNDYIIIKNCEVKLMAGE